MTRQRRRQQHKRRRRRYPTKDESRQRWMGEVSPPRVQPGGAAERRLQHATAKQGAKRRGPISCIRTAVRREGGGQALKPAIASNGPQRRRHTSRHKRDKCTKGHSDLAPVRSTFAVSGSLFPLLLQA